MVQFLLKSSLIKLSGAWISFSDSLTETLKEKKIDFPEKIQGQKKFVSLLENNENLCNVLFDHIKEIMVDTI